MVVLGTETYSSEPSKARRAQVEAIQYPRNWSR